MLDVNDSQLLPHPSSSHIFTLLTNHCYYDQLHLICFVLTLLCFKSKATGNEENPLAEWFQSPPPLLYSPVDAQPCPCGPAWQGQRKWPSINGSFDYSPVTNVDNMKDKKSRRMTSAPIRSTPMASTCSRDTFAEPFGAKTERHDTVISCSRSTLCAFR